MHQFCPPRVDPGQPLRAQPRPADTFTAPDQRPPWAHSYGQANIPAVGEVTDTDYYYYGDYSGDRDYGDYGDYGDHDYESQQVSPQAQSQFKQKPLCCNYAQPSPLPPPQTPAYHGNYGQPPPPPPRQRQPRRAMGTALSSNLYQRRSSSSRRSMGTTYSSSHRNNRSPHNSSILPAMCRPRLFYLLPDHLPSSQDRISS